MQWAPTETKIMSQVLQSMLVKATFLVEKNDFIWLLKDLVFSRVKRMNERFR